MASDGVTCEIPLVNEKGLHTRTSTEFVKRAMQFQSDVKVIHGGRSADGKSVMELLTLGAKKGTTLKLFVEGPDQIEALEFLRAFVAGGFPGVADEGPHHG